MDHQNQSSRINLPTSFSQSIIIQQKPFEMSSHNKIIFPLLKQIDLSILDEVKHFQKTIEAEIILGENHENIYHIHLVQDIIIIYSNLKNLFSPLWYIRFDFSVKFQRILDIDNTSLPKLKGFKLINDFQESLSFTLLPPFRSLASLWISHLARMLNENNFHKIYKPVRMLGKGAFASVYEIIRFEDREKFAAKVFSKDCIKNDKKKFSGFLNELGILRLIHHQNLLKFQGIFEEQNSFYIICEFLKGGNLFEYLRKRESSLSLEKIKDITLNLLKGLNELHGQGIVHRDIKLENIMIRQRDGTNIVIVDFGLAIFQSQEDKTNLLQCGTPGYLSPEMVNLKKGGKVTTKSDIFSAGVILHMMLTGRPLFEGDSSKEMFNNNKSMNFNLDKQEYKDLDSEILDLMTKMLTISTEQRLTASECLLHPIFNPQKEYSASSIARKITYNILQQI